MNPTKDKALTQIELACFHLQDPQSLPISTAALWLDRNVSKEDILDWLEPKIASFGRFRSRIVLGHKGSATWREVSDFSTAKHLDEFTLEDELIWITLSEIHSRPLPLGKPLWRAYLLQFDEKSLLVFRVHHSIADGMSLMKLLTADESKVGRSTESARSHWPNPREIARALWSATKLLFLPRDPETRLKGHTGIAKKVALTKPRSLDELKRVAKHYGVTINDLIVAVLARALDKFAGESLRDLKVVIPVASPLPRSKGLSNNFGLVFLALPLAVQNSTYRVQEAKSRMDALKSSGQALLVSLILNSPGRFPASWDQWLTNLFADKATTMMTNLRGPSEGQTVAGANLTDLTFWASTVGRLGSGFNIISYAGKLRIGVTTDANLIPDPGELVEALEQSWDELLA